MEQLYKRFADSYAAYVLMYVFYFICFTLFGVLLSVSLLDRGFTAADVSFCASCSMAVMMVIQPVIGRLADRFDSRKVSAVIMCLAACAGYIYGKVNSLVLISVFYALSVTLVQSLNPILEKYAVTSKYRYSSIRFWGTIGCAMGQYGASLIYNYISHTAVYTAFAVSCLVAAFSILAVREHHAESAEAEKTKPSSAASLFKNKTFLIFLLIQGLFWSAMQMRGTYQSAVLVKSGLSVGNAGLVIAAAQLTELAAIFLGGKVLNRISGRTAEWYLYGMMAAHCAVFAFVPGVSAKILIMLATNSMTMMLMVMNNMKVVGAAVEDDLQMTALSLIATFKSLITIPLQMISGQIAGQYGYSAMYIFLLCILAAGAVLLLFWKGPQEKETIHF